jgi:hypothetical protein
MFETFEFRDDFRPKTDYEYMLTLQATIATWELLRYERVKVAILQSLQRSAVEKFHRRMKNLPSTQQDVAEITKSAQKGTHAYFADREYRKHFAAELERNGYGSKAVEGDAYMRSLPSLAAVDRLIRSAEKRFANSMKILDAAYATRDPQKPMPRSEAARRKAELNRK